jgi:hypothetical protein
MIGTESYRSAQKGEFWLPHDVEWDFLANLACNVWQELIRVITFEAWQ